MNIFQKDSGLLQSNFCREGLFKTVLAVFSIALIGHPAFSATINYIGTESGTAASNWSNSGVNKEYDLSGNVYGTAGYYMIRPRLSNSPGDNIYQGASAGNNLGITATNSPTLYSKPVFINTINGGAGDYVNFNSYPLIRGPDGSADYLAGSLSVPVNVGPYNPEGISNAFFGEAFSFTTGVAATFRLAVAVDSVSDGTYAPNYVGLYNSGVGTKLSSALTRNGTMDMAVFEIDAAAGDSFTAAMWQLAGTQSAAAYGLVTFDVSKYNFNVASGSQTNSAVLNGAPAALVKTGDGVLIVTNANTYGGGTTVSAGTLELGNGGSVIGSITNNAVLSINRNDTNTLANAISGSGSLSKAGAGTVILTNANTYGGTTAVSAGRLAVAHGDALGSTSGGTTVESGAQLMLSNVVVGNEAVTINGNGLASGSAIAGSLRSIGTNSLGGKVTLGSNAMIFGGSGTSLTLDVASGDAVNLASHTLTIDGAGASRINDAIVGTGSLNKNGSATLTLAASNSYSGATTISAGRIALSGAGRLGSGAISIATNSVGTLELAVTGVNTMANDISGDGAILSSSGTTVLNGAVTSTGGLTVNSSTVRVGNAGSVSTATTVNSGGILDLAGTAGNVQLNNGGTLKGSGSVSALTVASGGTLAPGNSPGTLTASSATWNGGGTYAWEINNFLGSAGTNWDFLNITGGLAINASSGNKFIIDVISLLASNSTGPADNFNALSNYSFAIATAAGGITGFDSSSFDIQASKFSNTINPTGGWYVTQAGNSINLNYATAIPEPSTAALTLSGFGLLALLKRRRHAQEKV